MAYITISLDESCEQMCSEVLSCVGHYVPPRYFARYPHTDWFSVRWWRYAWMRAFGWNCRLAVVD